MRSIEPVAIINSSMINLEAPNLQLHRTQRAGAAELFVINTDI